MLLEKKIKFYKIVKRIGGFTVAVAFVLPILSIAVTFASCASAVEHIKDGKRPFINVFEIDTDIEEIDTDIDESVKNGENDNGYSNVGRVPNNFVIENNVDIGIDLRDYKDMWTGKSYAVVIDSDHDGIVRNDIILAINGCDVFRAEDVESILRDTKAGDTVSLVILRQEKELTVEIVLSEKHPKGVFFDQ